MKLYYNPLSTYSQKVLIALYEKGVPFEPSVVDLFSPESRAAFEQVTPIGKVPFLKDGDWDMPESTSIIEYLEDTCPGTPRLIPPEGGEAARQVRFIDRMADLYLNEPIAELLFQKVGFRPKDEVKAARMARYANASYEACNRRLARQPWLCGARITMADCAAIPPLYYAQSAFPFSDYPHLAAYVQRALQRPSYARVRAEFEPIWNGLMSRA